MTEIGAQLAAHRRSLADVGGLLLRIEAADLGRATPCGDWTLTDLLAHMIGQNHGFAAAVRDGDAPHEAFAPRAFTVDDLRPAWTACAEDLNAAFAAALPQSRVRLIEVREQP